jgi:predicted transcriptional regulator
MNDDLDASWFHIFRELIRSKLWSELSLPAKAVYPVIKAFINHQSGVAFPSLETLGEFSGLSRPAVVKALKELTAAGLLAKNSGQGRAASTYKVVEKFQFSAGDGRPAATVLFDYLPSAIKESVAELKNVVTEEFAVDGKTLQYIRIENLQLNVTVIGRDQNNNVVVDKETPVDRVKELRAALTKKAASG